MHLISIVLPAYREESSIHLIYKELVVVLEKLKRKYEFEIIFVNDGSPDGTWKSIEKLCHKDSRIKGIDLSRNFWKELALTAGIESATWDAIITIDVDGQHPVEYIPQFLEKWEEWYDIVYNRRPENLWASWLKKTTSRCFYRIFNIISEFHLEPWATDYRLITRDVAESYLRFWEKNRMYRGLIDWMWYSQYALIFDAKERIAWTATYGYRQLIHLAMNSLLWFSIFPLKFVGMLGFTITTISSILAIIVVIDKLTINQFWFTNIVMIVILNTWILGITLMALWLIALYIANIHEEVIRKPLYIVKRKKNFNN